MECGTTPVPKIMVEQTETGMHEDEAHGQSGLRHSGTSKLWEWNIGPPPPPPIASLQCTTDTGTQKLHLNVSMAGAPTDPRARTPPRHTLEMPQTTTSSEVCCRNPEASHG
mmetsp:Transcript_98048/g.143548  ORF Transcript_98048/g.143548 Transcript_98048/m.143548 type:complete len:111 (-) Transcript_98048:592-924(-)